MLFSLWALCLRKREFFAFSEVLFRELFKIAVGEVRFSPTGCFLES